MRVSDADGDLAAFDVSAELLGELAGVAAAVLRASGVHQAQRAVSELGLVDVQLQVAVPGQRRDLAVRLAVVAEDEGGVVPSGEGPVKGRVLQVSGSRAADGQVSSLSSCYFCKTQIKSAINVSNYQVCHCFFLFHECRSFLEP